MMSLSARYSLPSSPMDDLPAGEPVAGFAGEVSGIARQHIAQGGVALGPGVVVADEVGLGEVFGRSSVSSRN